MYWANFLHIYQPAEQQPDILEAIVVQSYRPILKGILKRSRVQLTFNVNGALLELFDKYKYRDLIDILRKLGQEQRIEFTSSSKYHAILPFLEKEEIVRQIKVNDETNKFFLGDVYKPRGFFPPEMAYKEELADIISDLGFKWIILDEIACGGEPGTVNYNKIYKIKNSNPNVFFRERRLSNLIMSAVVRSAESLKEAMKDDLNSGRYLITAMDGETFGHHRPGLEKMLFDVLETPEFELIQISDIPKHYKEITEIAPVKSTWASSKQDIENNIQFLSWSDPENAIHHWQWKLIDLVLSEVKNMDKKRSLYDLVRQKMDMALASDHLWWASAKPWWSLEMIEEGAFRLLDTIRYIPDIPKEKLDKAADFYEKIVSTAFNWQRTGKIRQMMKEQKSILRIPFKDRTVGRGGVEKGVYYAFIDMMKKLEKEAAKKGEYEKAILWRDAIFKLKNELDIYDTINAIDLLRVEIPHEEVEKTIEKYKSEYSKIRGGQPEQRGA
jgi:peptidoglycan/xylan/chitin deacetylase (PgdA/CDA1 family)